MSEDGPHDRNV